MKNLGNDITVIILETLPAIFIAVFGGFCEAMYRSEKTNFSVKSIFITLIVAGFVGMMVALLLYDRDVSPAIYGAAAGVAGASARSVMGLLQTWGTRFLKRYIDDV
jgi:hypothetical protein